jgi:hypothetical protein
MPWSFSKTWAVRLKVPPSGVEIHATGRLDGKLKNP